MILEQHYLACLSQASYLIADEKTGGAVVVDPRRDVDLYLERAEALGARIEHVLLTHFHADFLAGHLELVERTGATLWLGAAARAEYGFETLADGQRIELGDVRIVALATPGHTPESTCYLVHDLAAGTDEPHAVLTGDTLFIGDVGRPDLMSSVGITKEELASQLHDSLHEKILTLPDATLVYPGHGAGSACGKALSTDTVSTIGQQRAENYALQPMTREEFVVAVTSEQRLAPAYFPRAAGLNKTSTPKLSDVLDAGLVPLDVDAVLARRAAGATVLDVRPKDEYVAGHLAGSLWIGLEGRFAEWAGTVLDLEAPIVLVTPPGEERQTALRLARIGLDHVAGYLEGGAGALAARPEKVRTVQRVDVHGAAAEVAGDGPPVVLDVRTPTEYANGHVAGALSVPLARLRERAEEVPRDARVLIHCKSGYRSVVAASLLLEAGFDSGRLVDVAAGFDAWAAAGHPIEGAACASEAV